MERKLSEILSPYDDWSNTKGEQKNIEAKEALYLFYNEFSKLKPSNKYKKRDIWHMLYITHLYRIKKAFDEEKYMRVCNEIRSLIHYESFLQGRIYYNLIHLLEEFLNVKAR
ncbi:hypothetical protein CIW83_02960 [Tissierella sp. P1]|uniref:hypothetical protein n=1 Tax=Tissierella sp. P1 TaxID=1280483 RepID=UPI000BA0E890|nr:hypothetical protein [Tissierella sp. P1]OZV13523.1 hypothetical protein CIW83_02960 [Tissierella sp. P1]